MSFETRGRWIHIPVFAVALAALLLKGYQWYYARSLWLDEEMLFLNIRDRSFGALAGPLWMDQTAPLGWMALQRGILSLFGTGDRAVRLLSVLCGMGTVLSAVWIGLRWMRPAGAAVFVLLCGFTQWTVFYALEAKPYAADGLCALVLPALAVWAVETRRTLVWWIAAVAAQWLSYGATFVIPASAAVLVVFTWARWGRPAAIRTAMQGGIWLINFGLHYFLAMRHARASSFLADFWASGMLPAEAGPGGALEWFLAQAQPLASHPGGTLRWSLFWLVVVYGMVATLREKPALGTAWIVVPVSAALLAAMRFVPMKDRLAFWIVPALYALIATAAADSLQRGRAWLTHSNLPNLVAALLAMVAVWPLCFDLAAQGQVSISMLRGGDNHEVNDQRGMQFLMSNRRPGEPLVTTRYSLPAVWWYGGINVGTPDEGRRHQADGAPIIELVHHWPDSRACRSPEGPANLQRALAGSPRVLVFLGFDSQIPAGLQQLILDEISAFGALVEYKTFGSIGAAAIFDLQKPPSAAATQEAREQWRQTRNLGSLLTGCIASREARRW